ncbi:MAG: hypothetical protein M0R46_05460 [Candidatus Muirbacterium halophilum]|nr:hypothetical protein [Candidatus Muirbacterium halophilum]MCK9475342.1 hypothetical protein [Candidatus Muirbacterium halophilum]
MKKFLLIISIFLLNSVFCFSDVLKDDNGTNLPKWYKKDKIDSNLKDSNGVILPAWFEDWFVENQIKLKKEDFYYKVTNIINYKKFEKKIKKPLIITSEEIEAGLIDFFNEELKKMQFTKDNIKTPDWAVDIINSSKKDSKKDSFGNLLPDWYK